MHTFFKRIGFFGSLIVFLFFMHSCILKEYNIGDNKLDPDWDFELLFPLFHGNMEFIDFIYNKKSPPPVGTGPTVELEYPDGRTWTFPKDELFSPTTVIDSFNFLIEGDDHLTDASFIYTVSNGSPYPLNLRMRFFEKTSSAAGHEIFLPPAFPAGIIVPGGITPTESIDTLPLSPAQLYDFQEANRVEFVAWFDDVPVYNPSTLLTSYPINLSIVLSGVAHANTK